MWGALAVNRIGLPARCLAECQKLACASSCPLLRRYAEPTTCFSIPNNRSDRPFLMNPVGMDASARDRALAQHPQPPPLATTLSPRSVFVSRFVVSLGQP